VKTRDGFHSEKYLGCGSENPHSIQPVAAATP
jgi:hypothetical protein